MAIAVGRGMVEKDPHPPEFLIAFLHQSDVGERPRRTDFKPFVLQGQATE
jgi:hypothetical protein